MIEEFLKGLSKRQLLELQDVLIYEICGDIDFFLFKINKELANRSKPIKHWSDGIN